MFHKASRAFGVRLAGILGLCVYGGFWLSALTVSLYGGALSDKGGVPPIMGMDTNVVVFLAAVLILLAGWFLARARGV
jgi:lipopolysaccharide export LptBFGC system permease protein LptF